TGSFYVHIDHNVSHYVKVLLDAIFGQRNYRNEVIWQRTSARSDSRSFNHIHDSIFLYTKSGDWNWNKQYTAYDQDYTDKFYRYKDERGRRYMIDNLTAAGIRKGTSGATWRGANPTAKGRHWAVPASVRTLLSEPDETDTLKVLEALDQA